MSKIMDNYIAEARAEVRMEAIQYMIKLGVTKEQILTKYTLEDYEEAVRRMDASEANGCEDKGATE